MVERLDVEGLLNSFPSRFEVRPFFSPENDAIHMFLEDVPHFAERVDCWLTIYKAFEDKRVIGFKIKNIKSLLGRFEEFELDVLVSEKRVTIHLRPLLACMPLTTSSEQTAIGHYQTILELLRGRSDESLSLAFA